MSRRFNQLLLLVAVVSVSGIHLAFMQAGAWAMMVRDRQAENAGRSLVQVVSDLVSGAKPCERCLLTLRAGIAAHDDSKNDRYPPTFDLTEFRLIPCLWQPARVVPPLAIRLPLAPASLGGPAPRPVTPLSPPPELA
ncbi:MAG: hypothetical protein KDM63_12740 [Verrucomicrobiae bacterium]|nr:hypothetical protein [Verrucomicrobiae bacterium]